jgi:hypothetical protein
MTERVSLPPRPADGGGLPSNEDAIRERLRNAPEMVLRATLERDRRDEQILESRLEHTRLKIRLAEAELDARAGAPTQTVPPTGNYY